MTRVGADAAQLDATAAALAQGADLLDQIRTMLNTRIHHAPWKGHHGAEFRQDWDRVYYPRLISASVYLRDARAIIQRNADEQRHASDAGGGAIGSRHHVGGQPTPDELAQLLRALGITSSASVRQELEALFSFVLGAATSGVVGDLFHVVGDGGDVYDIAKYLNRVPGSKFLDDVLHKAGIISIGLDGLRIAKDLRTGNAADLVWAVGHLGVDGVYFFVGSKVKLALAAGTLLWDLGASRVGHTIEHLADEGLRGGIHLVGDVGAGEIHLAHRFADDMFSAPAGAVRFLRRRIL